MNLQFGQALGREQLVSAPLGISWGGWKAAVRVGWGGVGWGRLKLIHAQAWLVCWEDRISGELQQLRLLGLPPSLSIYLFSLHVLSPASGFKALRMHVPRESTRVKLYGPL